MTDGWLHTNSEGPTNIAAREASFGGGERFGNSRMTAAPARRARWKKLCILGCHELGMTTMWCSAKRARRGRRGRREGEEKRGEDEDEEEVEGEEAAAEVGAEAAGERKRSAIVFACSS